MEKPPKTQTIDDGSDVLGTLSPVDPNELEQTITKTRHSSSWRRRQGHRLRSILGFPKCSGGEPRVPERRIHNFDPQRSNADPPSARREPNSAVVQPKQARSLCADCAALDSPLRTSGGGGLSSLLAHARASDGCAIFSRGCP
eukprot:scaffold624_cov214-Pinguiococcus_pyrenoidosus.AAC.2